MASLRAQALLTGSSSSTSQGDLQDLVMPQWWHFHHCWVFPRSGGNLQVQVCWDHGRPARMPRNPGSQVLQQSLWDVSLLCSHILGATANVLHGNPDVLWVIHGLSLKKMY